MKKVWITSLNNNEQNIQKVITQLQSYRIMAQGHIWEDNLAKMVWAGAKEPLMSPDIGVWLIITDSLSLQNKDVLKGLSALALAANGARGSNVPLVILTESNLTQEDLPTYLQYAKIINDINKIGVKVSALINTPQKETHVPDYRINFHPLNELGLWIEIGPMLDTWDGVILGVSDGEINFQAVGDSGVLPEKCVLEFAAKGLKLAIADKEFYGCSVQNKIDAEHSYFARITQIPDKMIFTSNTKENDVDAYIISFC